MHTFIFSRVVPVRPGEVQLAHLATRLLRLRLRDTALRHRHTLRVHAAEAVEPCGRQAGLQRRPKVKMYGILDAVLVLCYCNSHGEAEGMHTAMQAIKRNFNVT